MAIQTKRANKTVRLKTFDEVESFGLNQNNENFESKQFALQHKMRVNTMLTDATQRVYEGSKAGAALLWEHITSVETDTTYWGPQNSVEKPSGEKKERPQRLTLLDLAPKDLTEEAFGKLGNEGQIDPQLVYFSQLRCGPNFQVTLNLGTVKCATVAELIEALRKDPTLAAKVQRIKIIWYQGKVTTVDNRRLKAHREAHVNVYYQKLTWDDLTVNERSHFDEQAPANNINVT